MEGGAEQRRGWISAIGLAYFHNRDFIKIKLRFKNNEQHDVLFVRSMHALVGSPVNIIIMCCTDNTVEIKIYAYQQTGSSLLNMHAAEGN